MGVNECFGGVRVMSGFRRFHRRFSLNRFRARKFRQRLVGFYVVVSISQYLIYSLLQVFEDTEFNQMEEEAKREAEREELIKEIG